MDHGRARFRQARRHPNSAPY